MEKYKNYIDNNLNSAKDQVQHSTMENTVF